jgi:hypothetical protein
MVAQAPAVLMPDAAAHQMLAAGSKVMVGHQGGLGDRRGSVSSGSSVPHGIQMSFEGKVNNCIHLSFLALEIVFLISVHDLRAR